MYENKEICSECDGACCKMMPGCCYPEDFGLPGDTSRLSEALRSGRYAIDWWEGDPRAGFDELSRAYHVRPAVRGYEGCLCDPSWGGLPCTFFVDSVGCSLSLLDRPRECRSLEPVVGDDACIMHDGCGKHSASIAWIPYTALLEEVIRQYQDGPW